MGHYFMVRFKNGKKEWSERFGGSGWGNSSPQSIRAWHKRLKKRKLKPKAEKILSIKRVNVKKRRKKRKPSGLAGLIM